MYIYYFFALILIWLGVLSLRGGARFYSYTKQELTKPRGDFTPFASIIAPCRGLDQGLRENLTALFQQNYPNYEIIFVVDNQNDAAVGVIEQLRGESEQLTNIETKLVVAGSATDGGQKVHNLRATVREVDLQSEAFVFVDSDARPNAGWLRALVAPLQNEDVGAATGYRWFIPKNSFAAHLRAVWNASIASALGANIEKNFCWGGSMAMRRDVFERLQISERWRNVVSDDFAVTRAMHENRLGIHFAPACLTASVEDCTFGEMLEFTTRQMKITRVYAAHLWKASLTGSLLFVAVFWTGVVLIIVRAAYGRSFWLPLALVLTIYVLGAAKAWIRLRAVKLVLPEYKQQLNVALLPHLVLWTLTPFVYLYNCLCAARSRRIVWRGITYRLESPTETVVLRPPQ